MARRFKFERFILIPICSVYEDGKLIGEERIKSITLYNGGSVNLESISNRLEKKANEAEKAKSNGPKTDRGDSKDVSIPPSGDVQNSSGD